MTIIDEVAQQLKIHKTQVGTVLELFKQGATIPFIARYRQALTGGLDENQLALIGDTYQREQNLQTRKATIIKLLSEKELLTSDLELALQNAKTRQDVEDFYLPYKQKRKTKAGEARKNGLESLAKTILLTSEPALIIIAAQKYLSPAVATGEVAIAGAKYLIAELVAEKVANRHWIRNYIFNYGRLESRLKVKAVDETNVFATYYQFQRPLQKLESYQILALNRGENEKVLTISFSYNRAKIIEHLWFQNKRDHYKTNHYIEAAINDSFQRLIKPTIEREIRAQLTTQADQRAITIFGTNLEKLLLTPAIKNQVVFGIDPGFKSGCKIAVVNQHGDLLLNGTFSLFNEAVATKQLRNWFQLFAIDVVVIGNGTASRETALFLNQFLKAHKLKIPYTLVSEAGASVYSASKLAQSEFPTLKVEQRSAVSIARRYQDALNELVKIAPKALGVGQYQHDVNQTELTNHLHFIVEKIVNQVGVNLNNASHEILKYVAGVNDTLASNILQYRQVHHGFKNRLELQKVKGMGPKKFQQAAGFLRIINSSNQFDRTNIHPESYLLAQNILQDANLTLNQFGRIDADLKFDVAALAKQFATDHYTVATIISAFKKPNRDIRTTYDAPLLKTDIMMLDDLEVGTRLEGRVTNVTDFGAFVEIGIKENGLIHKSNLSPNYVADPFAYVAQGEIVTVEIITIEKARHRVGLRLISKKT